MRVYRSTRIRFCFLPSDSVYIGNINGRIKITFFYFTLLENVMIRHGKQNFNRQEKCTLEEIYLYGQCIIHFHLFLVCEEKALVSAAFSNF